MKKLDEETRREVEKSERLNALVNNRGWHEAKAMLMDRISELDSISNIVESDKDPLKVVEEFKAISLAIKTIYEWIADVEGTAEQHEDFMESLEDKKSNDYIIHK